MNIPTQIISKTFDLNFGRFTVSPSYLQAGLVLILVFVIILGIAQYRRHMVNWSLKGALFGIFIGFVLALILEGFLIIGGKTVLTQTLGWKNAPKPLLNLLDIGKTKLVEVLGIKDQIPFSQAETIKTPNEIISEIQSLTAKGAQTVKSAICKP